MLRPGTNEITDAEWKAIRPHVAREVNAKEIRPFEVTAPKAKGGRARTLKDMPVSVAKTIIDRCENPETLKTWADENLTDELARMVMRRMRVLKIDDATDKKTGEKETALDDVIDSASGDSETGDYDDDGGGDDGEKSLEEMTKPELLVRAEEKGIAASGTKADIIAAIRAADGDYGA
jgi:hypothetical protein